MMTFAYKSTSYLVFAYCPELNGGGLHPQVSVVSK